MFPSADKLYGDADFIFQQDLAPAHTAKGAKSWFNDHVSVLCRVCHVSPPHVSLFGLFPVLVLCHY